MKLELSQIDSSLSNLADTVSDAESFVIYAREGMRRCADWPASRRDLASVWFGPREVNFDMYPNWWGDDRIVIIDRRRATEIGLYIAGISEDSTPLSEPAWLQDGIESMKTDSQVTADSWPSSWALPSVDPRILVPRALVQSMVGPLARGPVSGGWDLDGVSSTYVGEDGTVVNVT